MEVKLNWPIIFESMQWLLVEELKRRVPVHDGDLRTSIKGKIRNKELLIYMLSYGLDLEYGTLPGRWVSVDDLKKWCKDKWGSEYLAEVLQSHIYLYGTKPHPFIRETLIQEFPRILADALKTPGAVEAFN